MFNRIQSVGKLLDKLWPLQKGLKININILTELTKNHHQQKNTLRFSKDCRSLQH